MYEMKIKIFLIKYMDFLNHIDDMDLAFFSQFHFLCVEHYYF